MSEHSHAYTHTYTHTVMIHSLSHYNAEDLSIMGFIIIIIIITDSASLRTDFISSHVLCLYGRGGS